jgi:mono/diheme cytochrome c family protein
LRKTVATFSRHAPVRWFAGLALLGVGLGLFITRPIPLSAAHIAALPAGNAAHGETVFWAGGCASCHATPNSEGDAHLVLSGGLALKTGFGTFVAPNISSSVDHGIGAWPLGDFASAMLKGVSPEGDHYYPAFPYGSYTRMTGQDVSDLYAFMKTLPASDNVPAENNLLFPFNIRASIGGWKLLFLNAKPRVALATSDPILARGQYLVEGPGHCGECHTPRNLIGGFKSDSWLSGAPNPDGAGKIPNITPGSKDVGKWSADEIVAYLETGFTPEFDAVGGSMASVQKNLAKLPKADIEAIAAYLKAVPARDDGA